MTLTGLGSDHRYRLTSNRTRSSGSSLRSLSVTPSSLLRGMTQAQTGPSMPIWITIWYVHRAPHQEFLFSTTQFDSIPEGLNPNATSSITYSSSNSLTNLSPVPLEFYQHTDDTVFVPSIVAPQLPPPGKVIDLEVIFDTMNDGTNHAMFNMKTFNMPKVPTLLTQVQYAAQNISVFGFEVDTRRLS